VKRVKGQPQTQNALYSRPYALCTLRYAIGQSEPDRPNHKELMKICQYLTPDLITPDLNALDKESVLLELADWIAKHTAGLLPAEILQVLLDRERLGSTGIGEGFAIPHGKLKTLEQMAIAFGRSPHGVPFDSLDGKPAYYFFVLIAPEDSAGLHLKALAKISRFLKNSSFKENLARASDREALHKVIQEQDDLL
jgi:nitrogen PTS system EIIA component